MLNRLKAWQASQLAAGEARLERLRAQGDALEAQAAERAAARPAPEPKPAKEPPLGKASFRGKGGQLVLRQQALQHIDGHRRTSVPLTTVRSVAVEDGADFHARVSKLRFVVLGVVPALLFRKAEGGEKYLTVETDTAAFAVEVPRQRIGEAQKFAAALRTAVAQVQ